MIKIQVRRGTSTQWISDNPTLDAGEFGFETDTGKLKIGNATTDWTALSYVGLTPTEISDAINAALSGLVDGAPGLLDTLNELSAAINDDPNFFSTIATNLSTHASDTTNIHGIADTAELATKTYANNLIGDSTVDGTTGNTVKARLDSAVADLVNSAPDVLNTLAEISSALNDDPNAYTNIILEAHGYTDNNITSALDAHNLATAVHGFSDIRELETQAGAQTKADNAKTDAINEATGYIYNHPTFTHPVTLPTETSIGSVDQNEIARLNGVTSNVQDQLDAKAPSAAPTFSGTVVLPSTTSIGAVSATEIGYVNGVTSSIQDQIDGLSTSISSVETNYAPIDSPTFTGTISGIDKTMVGLTYVDNTSDANKPISDDTQAALNLKANLESPTFTGTVGGITKAMVGLNNINNTSDANKPISDDTQAALDLKAPIDSPTFTGTISGVTKAMVGLGNVDNTSDANKPISDDTQAALNAKASLSGDTFTGDVVISSTSAANSALSGALVVAGGIGTSGNIHAEGTAYFGAATELDLTNPLAFFTQDADSYIQLGIQNTNSGETASGDIVITADNGTNSSKFVDLGIASSTYNYPDYSAITPNDSYLIADGGNLVLDAGTGGKVINFVVGGTQSTDLVGSWSETQLTVENKLQVNGNADVTGAFSVEGDATVAGLITGDVDITSKANDYVPLVVNVHSSGQTADLTEWKNSTGDVTASVSATGEITATRFHGSTDGATTFSVNNSTSGTLAKGTVVYTVGVSNGIPSIAKAKANSASTMPAIGVLESDLAAGSTGYVVAIGQLQNLDTSAYAANQILYVSSTTAGAFTTTRPTGASDFIQTMGNVEVSNVNGSMLVNSTGAYLDIPNTLAVSGNISTSGGTFTGNGSGLTTLNASNLSSGTVPSARLSLSASDIPSISHTKISDFESTVKSYPLDSLADPVGEISMANYKITNLGDPATATDAANKAYVDNLSSGLRIKQAVDRATAAILPNSPTYVTGTADSSQGYGIGATLVSSNNTRLSVNGGNVSTGERVLVKNQADATQNGIYYVTAQGGSSPWILTRADDSNNSPAGEVRKGDYVSVLNNGSNGGTSWTIANDGTATTPANGIALGIDAINYVQFNGAATYVAGGGLILTGTTFDIGTADTGRIVVNADNIDLATVSRSDTTGTAGGSRITAITTDSYGRVTGTVSSAQADATTTTKGIASFDSGDFAVTSGAVTIKAAGIDNSQLANAKVTLGTTDLTLGSTVTNLTGLGTIAATTFSGALVGNVTGNASTVTNGIYTTDTATVTNAMLAGSIADSKLSTISTAGKVLNSATTATQANTASAIVARDASGNFTANIITAALSGNATTATNATSATSSVNAAITEDTTTNGSKYLTWVDTNTGNNPVKTTSTKLTFNPSTGALSSTSFIGNVTGNASTVTNGVYTTDTGTVTSAMILDGTIVNADINASAAIAVSKLAASTISGVTLGSNLNALTIGTGLSGTSYNGSAGVTVAIDSTVATLTGTQTLTNKTLTSPAMTTPTVSSGTLTVASAGVTFSDSTVQTTAGVPSLTTIKTAISTSIALDALTTPLTYRDALVPLTGAMSITINTDGTNGVTFPIGTSIDFYQQSGTGSLFVQGSGVTLQVTPGLKFRALYSSATITKVAANTWLVYGDLMA